jgi:SAM-dependent methyltransferase
MLMFGMTESPLIEPLVRWMQYTPGLHGFVPDIHRLQLEKWIWDKRLHLGERIMDVGVENPRRWLGDGYFTVGMNGEDIKADLLDLPVDSESLDGVVLTEVLEHCADPFGAIKEVHRVLKPGGFLMVTSPFFWAWHGRNDDKHQYPDYWRFTDQGWELLLKDFKDVQIAPCEWTPEGAAAYDIMRRFECMGLRDWTKAATGYLCEARR